jgi:hypothetical protein
MIEVRELVEQDSQAAADDDSLVGVTGQQGPQAVGGAGGAVEGELEVLACAGGDVGSGW